MAVSSLGRGISGSACDGVDNRAAIRILRSVVIATTILECAALCLILATAGTGGTTSWGEPSSEGGSDWVDPNPSANPGGTDPAPNRRDSGLAANTGVWL